MTRLRLIAPVGLVAALALLATGCAPATHSVAPPKPPASHSAASTPTPTPTAVAEPTSRYSVGCADLVPAASIAPLFSDAMPAVDPGADDRRELYPQLPQGYFISDLGGIDCRWSDGKKMETNGEDALLSVLPVTSGEWNHFITSTGSPATSTTYTFCTPGDSQGDPNTCEYNALVNGSWLYVLLDNMKPHPIGSGTVLPPAVHTVVASAVAALTTAGPPSAAATLPAGSIPLSNNGAQILTAAQVKSAIGVSGTISMDCSGQPDGPWSVENEAEQEVDTSLDCFFAAGNTGGGYGFLEWMAGGQWAEQQALAATPSEAPLAIPGLPAGDSAAEFTDDEGELTVDLVIGGNWVEYILSPASQLGSLPHETVALPAAMITLGTDIETTVRGS